MQKIPKEDLPIIIDRLKKWETFTAIALDYWVKAWTIQKRIGWYHPYSWQTEWYKIWEDIPNFYNYIYYYCKKYYDGDDNKYNYIYDVLYDYCLNLSNKMQSRIKNHPNKDGYLRFYLKKYTIYYLKSFTKYSIPISDNLYFNLSLWKK